VNVIGYPNGHDDDDTECEWPGVRKWRETQTNRCRARNGNATNEWGDGGVLFTAAWMINQAQPRGDTNQQQREGERC
jgi:hypothetical protein